MWSQNLTEDRDGYLALAQGLAEGRGFSIPGTQTPTAYRPPLYPFLLVPGAYLPSGFWTALLHLSLGLASVWLTAVLALRLAPDFPIREAATAALLSAAIVAVDPILLRYASFPMTETLATCLVTALLLVMSPRNGETGSPQARYRRSICAGVLFGLAALCRPTVWAFAGLMTLWLAWRWVRRRAPQIAAAPVRGANLHWGLTAAAAVAVVLPWGLRNLSALGHPILMTTHGGYTLLLGNNPKFYREVVDQPWGTVWDGSVGGGQADWVSALNAEMEASNVSGEVERDQWMSRRARQYILDEPTFFLRACWLRFRRFWGIMPVEGASDQPAWIRWLVGGFYSLVFGAAAGGGVHVLRTRAGAWIPSLLMVCGFMGVHLVYWTNTRMRAPVMPVIAVLAAIGWCQLRAKFREAS